MLQTPALLVKSPTQLDTGVASAKLTPNNSKAAKSRTHLSFIDASVCRKIIMGRDGITIASNKNPGATIEEETSINSHNGKALRVRLESAMESTTQAGSQCEGNVALESFQRECRPSSLRG